jgi:hypothetical protein
LVFEDNSFELLADEELAEYCSFELFPVLVFKLLLLFVLVMEVAAPLDDDAFVLLAIEAFEFELVMVLVSFISTLTNQ